MTHSEPLDTRLLWLVCPFGGALIGPLIFSVVLSQPWTGEAYPLLLFILTPPPIFYLALMVPFFISGAIFACGFQLVTLAFPSIRSNSGGASLFVAAAVIGAVTGQITLMLFLGTKYFPDIATATSGAVCGVILVYGWRIKERAGMTTEKQPR